jgi:hypothetical protein
MLASSANPPGESDKFLGCSSLQAIEPTSAKEARMITITEEQCRTLIEHAVDSNRPAEPNQRGTEDCFAGVIVDLAMGTSVTNVDLFVDFLWRRVTIAAEAGISPSAHRVWSEAVTLLGQLGEDLGDIFTGRPRAGLHAT